MTLIGYARVSTFDQDAALQHDALDEAGVVRTFTETASGASASRPELTRALDHLNPGDTLVVWKLDRLGRSLGDLIAQVTALEKRDIGFRSLTEAIDTTTPAGRLLFHLFGALAEFERDLIRERTRSGLSAARARGKVGGRPRKMNPERAQLARELSRRGRTYEEIASALGVSRATISRALAGAYDEQVQGPT